MQEGVAASEMLCHQSTWQTVNIYLKMTYVQQAVQLLGFFRGQFRKGLSGNAVKFPTGQPCTLKAASLPEQGN